MRFGKSILSSPALPLFNGEKRSSATWSARRSSARQNLHPFAKPTARVSTATSSPSTVKKMMYSFRTAEYLASGFFHNSQILKVDREKKTVTFQYRSWMEPGSRKKHYTTLTISVFEFIARMLYYFAYNRAPGRGATLSLTYFSPVSRHHSLFLPVDLSRHRPIICKPLRRFHVGGASSILPVIWCPDLSVRANTSVCPSGSSGQLLNCSGSDRLLFLQVMARNVAWVVEWNHRCPQT